MKNYQQITKIKGKNKKVRSPYGQKTFTSFDEDESLFALNIGKHYNHIAVNFEDIHTRKDKNVRLIVIQNEIKVLDESKTWVIVEKQGNVKPLDSEWTTK